MKTKCPVCDTQQDLSLNTQKECNGCNSTIELIPKNQLNGYLEYRFDRGENEIVVRDSAHHPMHYHEHGKNGLECCSCNCAESVENCAKWKDKFSLKE